ncbi:MAG TPA: type II secretion system F family protein [Xanthobacteraceae bacterium]|jgi:tight adherence protein B|nr:type II secretion system F family protein [Xanthobacteraceae bacterium]
MLGALPIAFLAAVAIGGVAYVFLLPLLSGEKRAEQRMKEVAQAETFTRKARNAKPDTATSRRQQVEETLKQLEERQKRAKRPSLSVQLQQSGLGWSKRNFMFVSILLGMAAFSAALFAGVQIYLAPVLALAAAYALPRWLLGFMKKRREAKFIEELPNAVDVIVRGVKSGLPVGDCIRIIASETKDPVKTEFRLIAESVAMGIPLPDAAAKMFDRIPLAEANFFSIVLSIQAKAGGNLSETLGNLSRVLRDRKKMREKIKAMSMEAKASAMIIGALPIGVMLLVYLTSPQYIELLWTTSSGRMMMLGGAVWMLMGVLVMKKMINFDF